MTAMRFYLGIHHPHWLRSIPVPVFVSHVALSRCAHGRPVRSEANCVLYALEWLERLVRSINPWHQPGLAVFA